MKNLFLLILLFLSVNCLFGQKDVNNNREEVETVNVSIDTIPFKGANLIKIHTNLESNETFIQWGRHLAQSGYSIAQSNKDFLNIETAPRDTRRFNFEYKVYSSIDDSGIVLITIKWRQKSNAIVGTYGTDYYDWEYSSSKGNVCRIIYDELFEAITAFGNYLVSFEEK